MAPGPKTSMKKIYDFFKYNLVYFNINYHHWGTLGSGLSPMESDIIAAILSKN